MFWPVIIAFGSGFAMIYYDGDGGDKYAFTDQTKCELALPALSTASRADHDFMEELAHRADGHHVVFEQKCVDKPPLRYRDEDLAEPPKGDRI